MTNETPREYVHVLRAAQILLNKRTAQRDRLRDFLMEMADGMRCNATATCEHCQIIALVRETGGSMIPAELYHLRECEYFYGEYRCPECDGQLWSSHDGRALRCARDGCWNVLVTDDEELRATYGPQDSPAALLQTADDV